MGFEYTEKNAPEASWNARDPHLASFREPENMLHVISEGVIQESNRKQSILTNGVVLTAGSLLDQNAKIMTPVKKFRSYV